MSRGEIMVIVTWPSVGLVGLTKSVAEVSCAQQLFRVADGRLVCFCAVAIISQSRKTLKELHGS